MPNLHKRGFSSIVVLIVILVLGALFYVANKSGFIGDLRNRAQSAQTQIYWGAWIRGTTYNSTWGDAPWDTNAWDTFESHTGKKVSILHWGQAWYWSTHNGYQPFYSGDLQKARDRGAIPLLDWQTWDLSAGGATLQPNFELQDFYPNASNNYQSPYDGFITTWATAAKTWGHPFFLRFDAEMNGNWNNYSELTNNNKAGEFVLAWRHVHDLFVQAGATNVTWVWCPNIISNTTTPLSGLYPGDAYVDWTCIDGYNWGSINGHTWTPFYNVFKTTYDQILTLAPGKPIMIAETASSETAAPTGSSKASWITDALTTQLPTNFPAIKAVVWFNYNADGADWVIETSSAAQAAFAGGIASNYFATNTFGSLPDFTKIQPLTTLASTPTPSPVVSISPSATPVPTASGLPNLNPVISITAPLDGSTVVRNVNFTINATATDANGISKVLFYVGSTLVCTDSSVPYSCSAKITHKRSSNILTAKAYDTTNLSSSAKITVNVK